MTQRTTQREAVQTTAEEPIAPAFPALLEPPRAVRVIAGADVQDMTLAGRTVGEARAIAQAIFGIHAGAVARLDGQVVGEETALGAGQTLEFVKHAGRKGARAPGPAPSDDLQIELCGRTARWRGRSGAGAELPVGELIGRIDALGPPRSRWRLLPRQVRLQVERHGGRTVGLVLEMPPGPRQVRWLPDDSDDPLGDHGRFETPCLSFPWVVVVLVLEDGELCGLQQAFYRTSELRSLDDPLHFTNLLNVAAGYGLESWLCLANLRKRLRTLPLDERLRRITDHFWGAAFTRSAEVHEGNSHWGTRRGIDPRLESVDRWEQATRADPYFTLHVAWPAAPATLGATLEGMLERAAPWRPLESAAQVATLMQRTAEPTVAGLFGV
jgi:hypothetical protein